MLHLSLDKVKVNEANPRQISDEKFGKLVDSVISFPKMLSLRPIVVASEKDTTILGGNMRFKVLSYLDGISYQEIEERLKKTADFAIKTPKEKEAIYKHWREWKDKPYAPVEYADELTDEEKQRFIIEDNVSFGRWDYDMLANAWDSQQLTEWGVDAWEMAEGDDMGLSTRDGEKDEKYNDFIEKFQPKLTTDDCYTPPEVYRVVREWVDKNIIPLKDKRIIRPFKPNGDYTQEDYSGDCIVLDNPPFSISAKIHDFYISRNIPFFLFSNGLILFQCSLRRRLTSIVIGEGIVFENGAHVNIGFTTNLCPEYAIWCASDLAEQIRRVQDNGKVRETINYDAHITSAALLSKIAKRRTLKIRKEECEYIGTLSDGTVIYGGGAILSDAASRRAEEASRRAELGQEERQIIARLNAASKQFNNEPEL